MSATAVHRTEADQNVWKALANPTRRRLLDLLIDGPRSTGDLADAIPGLSRFAVMQHLGVLTDAGLVLVRRRGRLRLNHLNPVPLRAWYRRWVSPLAELAADELIGLHHLVEEKGHTTMPDSNDPIRTVRIEAELRFLATQERVFTALTEQTLDWFPHTYGEDRVLAIVHEPRVGGAVYEDWGDGAGHLYGRITVYDPPHRLSIRGRLMPGATLDTAYEITPDGDHVVLTMSRVAFGPMAEDEAASIRMFGDLTRFESGLRRVIEG